MKINEFLRPGQSDGLALPSNPALPGRIDVVDVLRGFAIMGICLLHSIEQFNVFSFPQTESTILQFTDRIVWDGISFIFAGKAYAIFALLFGLSFFIQRNAGMSRGRFAWRMVLLFLFGNLNGMFFAGEVLVFYSMVSFVLILVCEFPTKAVLWIAGILLIQPVELGKIVYALANPEFTGVAPIDAPYWEAVGAFYKGSSFWAMCKANLWYGQIASLGWSWENGRVFQTAAIFMLGMVTGRKGLFKYSEANLKVWFNILIFSLVLFFPLRGLLSIFPEFIENKAVLGPLTLITRSLANFTFMWFLVSSIVMLYYVTRSRGVLHKLAPYGRMSLTNYFMQSILGSMLFVGWGFGLYRYLGHTFSALTGVGILLLQYQFCVWWLRHHKHGPLEWVWRKLTWIGAKRK